MKKYAKRRKKPAGQVRRVILNWALFVAVELVFPSVSPLQLAAQTTCVPAAGGVPGFVASWPIWWDADGDGIRPELPNPLNCNTAGTCLPEELVRFADPRWRGSTAHTFPSGQVLFRALYKEDTQDTVFLSWEVMFDRELNLAEDAVWFGIKENDTRALVFKLALNTELSGPRNATDDYTVQVLESVKNGGTWSPFTLLSPTPTWVQNMLTRVWTNWNGSNPPAWWAVQAVVPKNTDPDLGLDLGDDFDMWYTFFVVLNPIVAQYHWPDGRPDITALGGNIPDPANTSHWARFALNTTTDGSTCTGDVTIASHQIGTNNPTTPSSEILIYDPNEFVARPENLRTAASLDAHDIQADFYLANWGTQPVWTQVAALNTLWLKISPDPAPDNDGDIPAQQAAQSSAPRTDIHFSYQVPVAEQCAYDPNVNCPLGGPEERRKHQCVLVVLSSKGCECPLGVPPCPECPAEPPLVFRTQSVYRNMDFVATSSAFTRGADVSVVGLTPLPESTHRDVYLLVETQNLTERAERGIGDTVSMRAPERMLRQDSTGIIMSVLNLVRGRDRGKLASIIREATTSGFLTPAQTDSIMPTYRVHAYHATGDSIKLYEEWRHIVRAQTSFGYWIQDEGEVIGWKHTLEPDEGELIELAKDFYKIEVPNNGIRTITTTIQALHPQRLALSAHGGVVIAHGALRNTYETGVSLTADVEFRLTSLLSLEGLFGYHRFDAAIAGNPDLEVLQFSGGLKAFSGWGPIRAFAHGGAGTYRFDPGSTNGGVYGGAGIQLNPTPSFRFEVGYTLHSVFTSGPATRFSTAQVGMVVRLL